MAIVAGDIRWRLTTTAGGAGETVASTPAASLGRAASTTDLVDAALGNLFDPVTGDENAAGDVEYRCLAILNKHGALTWQGVKAWISSEVAGGASVAIGLDPAGVVAAAAVMAATIANEGAAPAGVVFSAPTTKASGLNPGDVPAGSGFALWVRRTAANTAALDSDGATLTASGDTGA